MPRPVILQIKNQTCLRVVLILTMVLFCVLYHFILSGKAQILLGLILSPGIFLVLPPFDHPFHLKSPGRGGGVEKESLKRNLLIFSYTLLSHCRRLSLSKTVYKTRTRGAHNVASSFKEKYKFMCLLTAV